MTEGSLDQVIGAQGDVSVDDLMKGGALVVPSDRNASRGDTIVDAFVSHSCLDFA